MKVTTIPAHEKIEYAKPKNVAAYCRVSTNQEIQLHSLAVQRAYFEKLIKSHIGWNCAGIYADEASGRNNRKMQEFQHMMQDCRIGKIDLILVKSISRLGRNTLQFLQAINELNLLGVDVVFQVENLHGQDPQAVKAMTIYASLYQQESETKSFITGWGHHVRFKNGTSKLYDRPCYGYRNGVDGHLEIHPEQAAIVKRIFAERDSGYSLRKIAKDLEADGVPAPRGGTHWHIETIRTILYNEKYCGTVVLGKTYVSDYFTGKQTVNCGEVNKYVMSYHHPAIVRNEEL